MAQNAIYNKALNAYNVPKDVYHAIKNAAAKTGVNFTYLMEKAAVESSFDKNAKSRSSSATGLYQFIESTWLKMVKDHGDKYGLEDYAAKITDDGRVSNRKVRNEILALRKDPEIASLMAAEFDTGNYNQLKNNVGGDIGSTELYMAHFLGAGGASGFLNAMKKSPNMAAADVFPEAARSNRNVFYDQKTGAARSLKQVYAFFDAKFHDQSGQQIMTASNATKTNVQTGLRSRTDAPAPIEDDPLARMASLINADNAYRARNFANANNDSVLRVSSMSQNNESRESWQIIPKTQYGRLSLSPAQLMMLSDFNA